MCPLCGDEQETIHHCPFDCDRIKELWRLCFDGRLLLPDVDFDPFLWLHEAVGKHGDLVLIVMWHVWCDRNKLIFDNVTTPAAVIAARAKVLHQDNMLTYNSGACGSNLKTVPREVSWKKPDIGNVSLNVDGSAISNPDLGDFGGLVRDSSGTFLGGFYGSVGYSNIMHAELMVLYHGIFMRWEKGFRNIVCYFDSLDTLRLVREGDQCYHKFGNEIAHKEDASKRLEYPAVTGKTINVQTS